jgi:HSP20 family molecular chaperone IbpA
MRWLQAGPEVQQLLRKGWVVFRHTGAWEPPTDVYENDVGLVVQVEIAGMKRDDFTIALRERMLVIAGVRSDVDPKRAIHQMEIHYGGFRAEIYLPWLVDSDEVEAMYEDGFLRVLLPHPSPRHLKVGDGSGDRED